LKVKERQKLLKFNTFRRVIQLLSLLLFIAMIFNWSSPPILLPVLWTWGFQQNMVGDAFTAMQLMLSGWSMQSNTSVFPWLAIASFIIFGVLIGKSLCGWVCPFGFVQDLVDFIKAKKIEISPKTHESLTYMKYFILGITLLISLTFSTAKILGVHGSYEKTFGLFAYAPFTAISPAETIFATLPKMIRDFSAALTEKPFLEILPGIMYWSALFWVQLFILVGAVILAVYVPRAWCKYLCPHGAIMAILNRYSFIGLRRDPIKCVKGECRECVKACPMRVRILELPWEKFSDPECIYCLKCADACPNKAISITYP